MSTGRLVVIEGLDGIGKTGLSWELARALGGRWSTTPGPGLREVRERFDAAFVASEAARSIAYGASVLAVGTQSLEWRNEGEDVVLDRYLLSTMLHAPEDAQLTLAALAELVPPADLTIYLEAPLEVRRARILGRGGAGLRDLETLSEEADTWLRARYRELLAHPVCGRGVVVDGSGTPEEVLARCLEAVGPGPAVVHEVRCSAAYGR